MARYLVERLNPTFGYFYKAGKTLHRGKTKWQDMEIIESEEFGNVLLLDGITQVTSRNEFLYHEPMVHPALVSHPNPKDVLIIGAGDGGILREVLKHPVKKAVMAELDGGVLDFCDRLLAIIHAVIATPSGCNHAIKKLILVGQLMCASQLDRFE